MGLAELTKSIFDRRAKVDPDHLRRSKPVRNTFVEEQIGEDGSLVLTAPLSSQGSGIMGKIAKRAGRPDMKQFELETVGSFVWQLCDGKHTFDAIAKKLRSEFKLNKLEADASLAAFLQMLSQRRLITLLVAERR